jgi:hypothetical protein
MGSLNFSIGEDFGLLLVNLAREKLLKSYDIAEASAIIVDALHGIKIESAIDVVLGKLALTVDVENQELGLDSVYRNPQFKYDFVAFLDNKYHEMRDKMLETLADLGHIEDMIIDHMDAEGNLSIPIKCPVKAIFNADRFIDINSEINDKYSNYIFTVKEAQELKDQILKIDNFARFLKTQDIKPKDDFLNLASELTIYIDRIVNFAPHRNKAMRAMGDYPDKLEAYFEANERLLNTKALATPKLINRWCAGWIDREGKLYAADGTIANFLHLKIADALVEHGVIPEEARENPDRWLENAGWAKMQENCVYYAGYYEVNDEILPLTEAQIQTISDIAVQGYDKALRVGNGQTLLPATKFLTMDRPLMRNLFKL